MVAMAIEAGAKVAPKRSADASLGVHGGVSPSPDHLGTRWIWKWNTVCHPAGWFA